MRLIRPSALALLLALVVLSAACGGDDRELTVYSGRSSELVDPIL